MALKLPQPVAAYFIADRADIGTFVDRFTADAVVKDERHTYRGLAAIRKWKTDASKQYTYIIEPFASEEKDGLVVVTGRLTGDFPGSPLDLRFCFRLQGDKIASLEIIP